ncbi:hypothetical protein ABW636_06250 [Aquimarina sp. 2201CG1-2-11]|uniref:hypothetical protein n=1 Tax=Aquimarina discodermiae TaxID=3231043 RepID=UPI0034634E99
MNNRFSLKAVLSSFSEDSGLDNTQVFGMLKISIEKGTISLDELKKELDNSIVNECDWVKLASETNLLEDPTLYSNQELINYVKMWLWDYLYPEKALTENQIEELEQDVVAILKGCSENRDWMFSYDLYDVLKEDKKYKDLEYYNLWKLDFYDSNIERKPIEEEYQEIGYLRYKK